jgi:predicted DNA-binding transcriptional regulator YafY
VHIERAGPATYRLTLHAYELAALASAARWAAEGGEGELSAEAQDQLRSLLESYDSALARTNAAERAGSGPG